MVGRGGPEVSLGPGPATRWRPKAGNGGQGEREAAGPRKKAIWTWGPGIQTPELFPPPRTQVLPPATTPISLSSRPRKACPPQKATFKLRQICLSPPPPLVFPQPSSCPGLDFLKSPLRKQNPRAKIPSANQNNIFQKPKVILPPPIPPFTTLPSDTPPKTLSNQKDLRW